MDGQIPQRLRGPLLPRGRTKHTRRRSMTVQQDTTEVVNMNKTLKNTLRTMIVLAAITLIAQGVAAAEDDATTATGNTITGDLGVGIALGLAAIGAGFSQAAIGSAAVGMLAEDGSKFGPALIFTALPESIVILGALPLFLGN
ncbi:MAG: hypothetical protein CBD01_007640 [Euryarchaeota archaeon TMED141]|nr:MAG: hypothetical protein CBD01_007640 [Euryarchaeota archaeon TMED141]